MMHGMGWSRERVEDLDGADIAQLQRHVRGVNATHLWAEEVRGQNDADVSVMGYCEALENAESYDKARAAAGDPLP